MKDFNLVLLGIILSFDMGLYYVIMSKCTVKERGQKKFSLVLFALHALAFFGLFW